MTANPLARGRLEIGGDDEGDGDAEAARAMTKRSAARGGATMSMGSAAAVLMTWSTSSSNVMYPYCFGVLGVGLGPALMLLVFAASFRATRLVVDAALECGARTLGDVGAHLGGTRGRFCLESSQLLFQQLFLPVAVVLSVDAVQAVARDVPWYACNVRVVALFAGVAFGISQAAKRLGHVVACAYLSVTGILLQTAALLSFCLWNDLPTGGGLAPYERWRWGPAGDAPWHAIGGALGVFVYSCLPACVVVETMAEMAEPERMRAALPLSYAFYIVAYLVSGIPVVLRWGSAVANPVNVYFRGATLAALTVNGFLVYSTLLDFVIAATTVNRFVVKALAHRVDAEKSALAWAAVTAPVSLVAVAFAIFVPRLDSLTGLLNSVTGTTLQFTGPALCGLAAGRRPRGPLAALAAGGFALAALVFAQTVHSVARTDYGAGNFWCDVVG